MDYIEKLIEQAPWAAALTIVVIVFVRFLKHESTARAKRDKAHAEQLSKIIASFNEGTAECHDVQLRTVAAIGLNSERLKTNTEFLGEVKVFFQAMNGGST